jgi:hypothetical protein
MLITSIELQISGHKNRAIACFISYISINLNLVTMKCIILARGILFSYTIILLFSCHDSTGNCSYQEEQQAILKKEVDSLKQVVYFLQSEKEQNTAKVKKSKPKKQPILTATSSPYKIKSIAKAYNSSGQCMGTTKNGNRCRRTVRSGNYCWQHGG